jgi:Cu(I)/Ag(I) efflux system membrane fusion protein
MKNKSLAQSLVIALLAAGVLGAAGYGLYALGVKRGAGSPDAAQAGAAAAPSERKVLYWHDPMVPGQKFDKPGKSPFMDMPLVPVYADDGGGDTGGVSVSSRIQQSLGLRTAEVKHGTLSPQVQVAGNIAFNERDQVVVQARATGYIERLHVRATLDRVTKDQPLADLYVPDWVAAQEEFLSVRRMQALQGNDLAALLDGARQRLRQAGMNEEQIRGVETSGTVQPRITMTAPIGGVVVELLAREGMTVMPGATLFRINSLSTVWANAEVPESQAALLRAGSAVQARSPALPERVFKGRVQTLLPDVNPDTRTLKARIELANSGWLLAPGMFVSVSLGAPVTHGLMVPTEALIQTGKRSVVVLALGGGQFRPVEVEPGIEAEGETEIRHGLQAGQQVVLSGQFLLDSEASLKATTTRMEDAAPVPSAADKRYTGEGRLEAIDKDAVTLSHAPIPALKWGAMTMEFGLPVAGLLAGLKPGQSVRFEFILNKEGSAVLTRIEAVSKTSAKAGKP